MSNGTASRIWHYQGIFKLRSFGSLISSSLRHRSSNTGRQRRRSFSRFIQLGSQSSAQAVPVSDPTQSKNRPNKPPKALPPRPPLLPESEIESSALHGSGPGGQKINKTSSAMQLKHLPTGVVVKCQATRSRSQNMKLAQRLLADKVDVLRNGGESRTEVVRQIIGKKKSRAERRKQGKYRAREEAEGADRDDVEGVEEEQLDEQEIEILHIANGGVDATNGSSGNSPQSDASSQVTDGKSAEVLERLYEELRKRKTATGNPG